MFSPNDKFIGTGTSAATVAVFDIFFSKLMEVQANHFFVTKIVFSEDDSSIISIGADYSIICQKVEDKRNIEKMIF